MVIDEVPSQFPSSLSLGRRSAKTTHGLGDTLDVVTKDLAVTLGAALSETLSTLSAARHVLLGKLLERSLQRITLNQERR